MKVSKLKLIISLTIFALLCTLNAQAGSGKVIMARMKARLPEINKLKTQGIIGETKDGFIAFIKDQQNSELLKAENSDRKKVYAAIGRQQGADPTLVGQRRALQIAKKAKPGTWLQNKDGKWYKK